MSQEAIEPLLFALNKKSEMRSFKSNENIHKKEGGSYYVVSANKASSLKYVNTFKPDYIHKA